MPRNEDGEFELILGNKQLLSVFFIVVVLLGVFFTMGYIVGRNSAPVGAAETASSRHGGDGRPIVLDPPSSSVGQAAPPPSGAETTTPTPAAPVETKPPAALPPTPEPARTEPARPEPAKPEPVKPEPPKPVESRPLPKPDAPAPAKPKPRVDETEVSPASPRVSEPSAGLYLQVSAVRRPEAETLVDVLRKKGFSAVLARSPKEGLFRVLVGPMKDAAAAAKVRNDLEAAGLKNPSPVRY
jgi:cell division protein FtsN